MFKNIRNYIKYRKLIEFNRNFLLNEFNLRIDKIYRLYTTVGIPLERQEMMKTYGFELMENERYLNDLVLKYIGELQRYLMTSGIIEFIGNNIKMTRFDQVNVDIILEFRFLNLLKFINTIRISHLILILISIGLLFLNPLFSLIPLFGNLLFLLLNKIVFGRFLF